MTNWFIMADCLAFYGFLFQTKDLVQNFRSLSYNVFPTQLLKFAEFGLLLQFSIQPPL